MLQGKVEGDTQLQPASTHIMDADPDFARIGLFKRKEVGKTECNNCHAFYNNASVPEYCSNKSCNAYIGGRGGKKLKTPTAFMINKQLATVRVHEKGHETRAFASIGDIKKAGHFA